MVASEVDGVRVLVCQVEGQFSRPAGPMQPRPPSAARRHPDRPSAALSLHGGLFDVRSGACLGPPATKPVTTFPVLLEAGKVHVDVSGAKERPRPRFGPLN